MRIFIFLSWLLFFGQQALAQQQPASSVFLETAGEGSVRFYFDDHYYLVDRNCTFKTIERVAGFDVKSNQFDGRFTDFDNQGKIVAEGSYTQGKKNGPFKAYHPNGVLKWETRFVDDRPEGPWEYYYPDGRLMLHLQFDSTRVRVITFQDQRGRQRVKNGNGLYDFKVPFEGYNPYGYPFVRHRGRLKGGLPHGYWEVFFQTEGNQSELIAEEEYKDGLLREGLDLIQQRPYRSVQYSIFPTASFLRAESLISKPCSYDDHVGFTAYLSQYLTRSFSRVALPDLQTRTFAVTLRVDREGQSSAWKLSEPLHDELDDGLLTVLQTLDYFIPSVRDDELINDELTLRGELSLNEEGRLEFHSISIEREAGS